jgi:1-acyl-sn-glycerol-3-phosphate acyltransferase
MLCFLGGEHQEYWAWCPFLAHTFAPCKTEKLQHAGHVVLNRSDATGFKQFIALGKALLSKGASLAIFPEGTRSLDGKLGEFKKGAFTIATMAKVVVVPLTILGTGDVMPPGREGMLHPGEIKLIVHPPISTKGKKTAAVAEECRSMIASRLPAWKTAWQRSMADEHCRAL